MQIAHYNSGVVGQRQSRAIQQMMGRADRAVAQEGVRALVAAATVRGAAYVADELMTCMDRLRRHEAQAAAADPIVADEYTAVRRRLLAIGLNVMDDYGRRLP